LLGKNHVVGVQSKENGNDDGEAAHATKSPQDVSTPSPNRLSLPLGHEIACFGRIDTFESRLIARFEKRVKREERLPQLLY